MLNLLFNHAKSNFLPMNPPTEDTTNPDGPKEGIIGNNQPNNSGNNQFKNSGNLADNNSVNPGYNNPPDILSEEENGNPGTKNTKLPDNCKTTIWFTRASYHNIYHKS